MEWLFELACQYDVALVILRDMQITLQTCKHQVNPVRDKLVGWKHVGLFVLAGFLHGRHGVLIH